MGDTSTRTGVNATAATRPQPQQQFVQQPMGTQLSPRMYKNYNARLSGILGILQIVGAMIAIVVSLIGILFGARFIGDYVGTGLGCSVMFILSGSFAICAARRKTKCTIVTHLVLAIIATVMAGVMFVVAVSSVLVAAGLQEIAKARLKDGYFSSELNDTRRYSVICSFFLLVSILQLIVTIWSSTLGCLVLCRWDKRTYQEQPYHGQPQQLVLDRYGRPVKGAQIIHTAPSDVMIQNPGAGYPGVA